MSSWVILIMGISKHILGNSSYVPRSEEVTKYTFFTLKCISCPYNYYSLRGGSIFLESLSKTPHVQSPVNLTNQVNIVENPPCLTATF